MPFNIYQLDNLSYDEVEPLLEDYIDDAVAAFVDSDIGQAYVEQHPVGGNWIATFIEMAYLYGGHTLPKLTKGDAKAVMEQILPRKLTLMDPSEAEGATEELAAFWTFLSQTYGFRSAAAIAKYLRSIGDRFPQWMVDPQRGGMAKQFLMANPSVMGDSLSSADQDGAAPSLLPPLPLGSFTMDTPPPDMALAFERLGLKMPAVGETVQMQDLLVPFLQGLANLPPDEAEELMQIMAVADQMDPLSPSRSAALPLTEDLPPVDLTLSDQQLTLLREQTFSATQPGPILKDFQMLLDHLVAGPIKVSGKWHQFPAATLKALNGQLSYPVQLDLKRPQQKSYPHLQGMVILLRAAGLALITQKGKQFVLHLNPEIYAAWQALSPTEQYFSLLEIWMIRAHPEIVGDKRGSSYALGYDCLRGWHFIWKQPVLKYANTQAQQDLHYWPGLVNLALLELFGMVEIKSGAPEQGKGWRIRQVKQLPWGDLLVQVLQQIFAAYGYHWRGFADPTRPLGELQPTLQTYIPDWQNSLPVPSEPEPRAGRHIFKVSLGRVWRRIAIDAEATLADLSRLILDSVDFDDDHLDLFRYPTPTGRQMEVTHPWADGPVSTDEVTIGSLPIAVGQVMDYIFDFGDYWQFKVQLEAVETDPEEAPVIAKVKGRRSQPRNRRPWGEVLESHGQAPPQYPDYDDED
jgi:hypothetical protein